MVRSNNVHMPIFYGQDFEDWSKKMEKFLVEEGLWYVIEEGNERPTELCNDDELRDFRENKANDKVTLLLIHKALSPKIVTEVRSEKTAKTTWDLLQLMYYKCNGKTKINDETPQSSKEKHVQIDISSDDEDSFDAPASRDMPRQQHFPHNDFLLTTHALKPHYKLYLPSSLELPSSDMIAVVRSPKLRKQYKIPFNGKRKRFGVFMWRKFVKDHNLREGHRLKFNVVKCDETSFIIKIST